MATYLISYDLLGKADQTRYDSVEGAIGSLGRMKRITESTRLLESAASTQGVFDAIRIAQHVDDRLAVVRIGPGPDGTLDGLIENPIG